MTKKEVIIVVPGVKGLSKWPKLVVKICYFLCDVLKYKPVYIDHLKIWKVKIRFGKNKILWFQWNRTPDFISKAIAVKRLRELIGNAKNRKIKLVGISMGGEIILEAIKKDHPQNIKKIILVCSINETRSIAKKNIKVVNIYSLDDRFAEAVIETFSLFNGSKKLDGDNVININLPKMEHEDFCANAAILKGKYKGKTPADIVNKFLRD